MHRVSTATAMTAAVALLAGGVLVARSIPDATPRGRSGAAASPAAEPVLSPSASPPDSATQAPLPTPRPLASSAAPDRTGLPAVPRPGEPVAARDAAGLARALKHAAAVLADPSSTARDVARQAHVHQVAVRALVNGPQRRDPTYRLLEPALRRRVVSEVTAGAQLRAMLKRPKTTLPPWRIVAPAPASTLLGHYRTAAREFGIGWEHLAAIHLVETRMGRIRGTSSAGAQGPMQFMPATWRQYGGGGDIHSTRDSIRAAARYLVASGARRDIGKALFAYNRDRRYVDAVVRYADELRADSRVYTAYHGWQVYYVTVAGDVWLPVGYDGS